MNDHLSVGGGGAPTGSTTASSHLSSPNSSNLTANTSISSLSSSAKPTSDGLPGAHRQLDLEPNPFEMSFKNREDPVATVTAAGGAGGVAAVTAAAVATTAPTHGVIGGPIGAQYIATPGGRRHLLPPVASLESPQPLLNNPITPGTAFLNSLRSGPLSPAMLQGPQNAGLANAVLANATTAFPHGAIPTTVSAPYDQSLPTPQGLTGSGLSSFTPLTRGLLTPDTSALFANPGPATAAILNFNPDQPAVIGSTGLTPLGLTAVTTAAPLKEAIVPTVPPVSHGLVSTVSVPAPMSVTAPVVAHTLNAAALQNSIAQSTVLAVNQQQQLQKAVMPPRADPADAANSLYMLSKAPNEEGEPTDKPKSKSKAKRQRETKTDDEPSKRAKTKKTIKKEPTPVEASPPPSGDSSKSTEEDKRKSFLERNRVAALKCRQRKKQWLENLQAKVEYFTSENETLTAQVSSLTDQVLSLKSLLLHHKDCNLGISKEDLANILNANIGAVIPNNPRSLPHQAKVVAAAAAAATTTRAESMLPEMATQMVTQPPQPQPVAVPITHVGAPMVTTAPVIHATQAQVGQMQAAIAGTVAPAMPGTVAAAAQQMVHPSALRDYRFAV